MDNPRSEQPDMETFEDHVTMSGSSYTVVVIGGREAPGDLDIETVEQLVNDYGEFPLGEDPEFGVFHWTCSTYIHHPEVEGAMQCITRSFHDNRWSAQAARDRALAQLRNPLAVAHGADTAEDVSITELRKMLTD